MDKAPSTQQDSLPRALSELRRANSRLRLALSMGRSGANLSGTESLVEGLRYRPQSEATRATFDLIMTIVAEKLGDIPREIVRSAADALLEYLKDEDLEDFGFDRKKEIDDLLGACLSPGEFDELVSLGKKITDYDDDLSEGSLSCLSPEEIKELIKIGMKITNNDLLGGSLSPEEEDRLDTLYKKMTDPDNLLTDSLSPEEIEELFNPTNDDDLLKDPLSCLSPEEINKLDNLYMKIKDYDGPPEDVLSPEEFNELANLGRKIMDHGAEDEEDEATIP